MDNQAFLLLIHGAASEVESIRLLLPEQEGFRLLSVTRATTALARLAGGGVDAILVDLSDAAVAEGENLEKLQELQSAAARVPIVVLCDTASDSVSGLATRLGAAASLTKEQCKTELKVLVRRLIESRRQENQQTPAGERERVGPILTVLGSKGGVGATTVAANVACTLAQDQRVILAELRPARGTISQQFHLHNKVCDLTSLLAAEPDAIGTPEIEACLWPYRNIPGLRILFGPQGTDRYAPISFDHAKAIVQGLGALADHVVIDVPSTPSDANRAVIQASECLALVVERDLICLEAARLMLQTITSWGSAPHSIGTVIVNRAPLMAPPPIEEFETRLGVPLFAIIPPAPDDCLAAQRANRPLVAFDGDSLVADSLVALARLMGRTTEPFPWERKLTVP